LLAQESSFSPIEPVHVVVPGRARFHVQGLYHSRALKLAIERELAPFNEIHRVCANPLTGNVLIEFDPQLTLDGVTALLEEIVRNRDDASGNDHNHTANDSSSPATRALPARINGNTAGVNGIARVVSDEPWHCRNVKELEESLGTSDRGLSPRSVAERLRIFGPNRLKEPEYRSGWAILLDQFNSMPTALLIAAAGISLMTGGVADAVAIAGVLVINASIGFFTESESEKAIRSLSTVVQPSASVMRAGKVHQVPAENVVPGDVVALRPGTYVCADARIIESENLTVDESALTGESLPVAKTARRLDDRDVPLADRTNMVYMGTLVTGGEGLAVVVATGQVTELGQIQKLAGEAEPPETPMERQLDEVGRQLVLVCTGVCGLVFGIGLLRGYALLGMLETAISLAVASVPEGLPTIAATTLALGIQKMRRHGVIVRTLDAVETLGCVQTICLDKTGTLTLNRMEVTRIRCAGRILSFRGGVFLENDRPLRVPLDSELRKMAEVCVLCSESAVMRKAGRYEIVGSSTENALVEMALAANVDPIELRTAYPLTRMIRRSEKRNYMCSVHRLSGENRASFRGPLLVAVKGSPTEVLEMCSSVLRNNQPVPLTEIERKRITAENNRMGGAALRVLGIAYREMEHAVRRSEIESELTWVGLVGMSDPIRDGVDQAIEEFHCAGIDTVMITGDQRETAMAIGKELALSRNGSLRVFDTAQLDELGQLDPQDLSENAQVFARVSPAHKLQIVQALQRAGRIVAMTGDGINDSPALKAADIGIAMGSTGTDAARNVADVVLENDDLQTMLIAINEGRTIYSNIRKSLHFVLSTNFSEIVVMFAALAAGLGQPFNAMQLLWINLISDVLPGLALALEPPEADVMTQAPRDAREPVLKSSDLARIGGESLALSGGALAAYGYGIARYGVGAQASTLGFTSLIGAQLLHSVSCRSASYTVFSPGRMPPNNYLRGALAVSAAVQALTLLVPGLRGVLGLTTIGPGDAMIIAAGAVGPFLVNEGTKLLCSSGAPGHPLESGESKQSKLESKPRRPVNQSGRGRYSKLSA
jgi:P-type Ca2+ transporter type 2C